MNKTSSTHAHVALTGKSRAKPIHRRSALSECLHSLYPYLEKYGTLDADGIKRISHSTARERSDFIKRSMCDLHREPSPDGTTYRIRDVRNFGPRHVKRLAEIFEARGYSAAAIQKYFSFLRTFVAWIGKNGMITDAGDYLNNPNCAKRIRIATTDKGWESKGVDPVELISKIYQENQHVGICLFMQYAFGLRAKEAWLLHPKEALEQSTTILYVTHGTKGGRPREVPIEHVWQIDTLKLAASLVNSDTGSLIPERYRLGSWRKYFYQVCDHHGINRKNGIVTHGLRHDAANSCYQQITGFPSSVRTNGVVPSNYDKVSDNAARLKVAEQMGHGRKQVSSAYLGSFSKARNRETTDTARAKIVVAED